MRLNRVGVVLALGFSAAFTQAAAPSPMLSKAKKIIADEVLDPSSVQYRNLRVVHATVQEKALTIACGEYNAKNKMGGYTGFAKFAYEPTVLNGVVGLNSQGTINFFGDAAKDRGAAATETSARSLGVCLGVSQ